MGKNKNKKYTEEQIEFVKDLVVKGESVTRSTMMMCLEFNLDYNENIGRRFRKIMQNRGVTNNVAVIEETDVFKEAQHAEEVPPSYNPALATKQPRRKITRQRLILEEWQKIFDSIAAFIYTPSVEVTSSFIDQEIEESCS